jgi:hypothetical protein
LDFVAATAGTMSGQTKPDLAIAPPLPHSLDAERAFLGAVLVGAPPSELDRLDVVDFYIRPHQVIFGRLKQFKNEGKPTNDSVLLYESLAGDQRVEEAGGLSYLSGLASDMYRTSNLGHYATIIKEKSFARGRILLYQAGIERLSRANGNLAELLVADAEAFESALTHRVEAESNRITWRTAADAPTYQQTEWLVKGVVPKGAIVNLNAKIKAGKTAFVLAMSRAVIEGLDFLGEPTAKTNVVYLTEQAASSFDRAIGLAGLRGLVGFSYLRFTDMCGFEWSRIADIAAQRCKETQAGLLVVDTLSKFCGVRGDSENDAGPAHEAMLPLEKIAADGVSTVNLRHGRKSGGDVEDAARGSSAFDGAADLILSLKNPGGNAPSNRRLLESRGRYQGETHDNLLIEMVDGAYTAIGSQEETVISDAKDAILSSAPTSETDALTIAELADSTKISKPTVQRACDELVRCGKLQRLGKGKRGSPFLHWLGRNRIESTSFLEVEVDSNPKGCREPGEQG